MLCALVGGSLLSWHESLMGRMWKKEWRVGPFGLFGMKEMGDLSKIRNN